MARRSTTSDGSSDGAPCTWQRNPSSAYLSAREMPDLASRKLASTSWVLLPMDETTPIPVTTTRLMPSIYAGHASRATRLRYLILPEQPHFEINRLVNDVAIGGEPAVGNAEHEFRAHHSFDVEP